MTPFTEKEACRRVGRSMRVLICGLGVTCTTEKSRIPFADVTLRFNMPSFLGRRATCKPGKRMIKACTSFRRRAELVRETFARALLRKSGRKGPRLFPGAVCALHGRAVADRCRRSVELIRRLSTGCNSSCFMGVFPGCEKGVTGCVKYEAYLRSA